MNFRAPSTIAAVLAWTSLTLSAQTPGPSVGSPVAADTLLEAGHGYLEAEDSTSALRVFRRILANQPQDPMALLGLGQAYLLEGRAGLALRYARAALGIDPGDHLAQAMEIRALLRARHFAEARELSQAAVERARDLSDHGASAELLAAHASSLFRVQQNDRAAEVYRQVLQRDPLNEEAHLRLGSGLTSARAAKIGSSLRRAIRACRSGRTEDAIRALRLSFIEDPGNPIAHRLLGESLFNLRASRSMAGNSIEFRRLRAALPMPRMINLPLAEFMPQFSELRGERRRIAMRALALFGSRLQRIVAVGGRHDLLLEDQRTTDAPSRLALRGKRTFDGRVWDDVRGIGGLRAATGIEALDEAALDGFDTLAHEIAHQVHLYAFSRKLRRRIRELYHDAVKQGRFLDYYAAINDAEYFGQGVEAFVSLGKRPTPEATHGHTRFELMRIDPELHDFIRSQVDHDPLRDISISASSEQIEILEAAIAVALRCGRPADAVTAAGLLPAGPARDERIRQAERALQYSRSL